MTTTNEPLVGIQARIEELQNTIAEKEEQIKTRARKLKTELQEEISPIKLIRQHPFEAVGTSFFAGLLLIAALRSHRRPAAQEERQLTTTSQLIPTQSKTALSAIGLEVLRSVKDLGFTYLQRYLDKKII
ncbi:MAG: hypothetical protein WCH30_00360 [Chlorobiaceae bacterium]